MAIASWALKISHLCPSAQYEPTVPRNTVNELQIQRSWAATVIPNYRRESPIPATCVILSRRSQIPTSLAPTFYLG